MSGVTSPLFPTPEEKLARSGVDWERATWPKSGGDDLTTAVARLVLLPTPRKSDTRGRYDGGVGTNSRPLCEVIHRVPEGWGDYLPAIRQWEPIMGEAPPPTVISSRTKKPTLNHKFVEWMMGVQAGFVTDTKVSRLPAGHRAACLSLLGDGVVPQAGAAAYKHLLEVG